MWPIVDQSCETHDDIEGFMERRGFPRCVSRLTVLATACNEDVNTSGHDDLTLSLYVKEGMCQTS